MDDASVGAHSCAPLPADRANPAPPAIADFACQISLEPPSWRRCWYETGRLLPKIFPDHEAVGLARLQNDCLIALTARYTGTLLLAADGHFATLRRYVPFPLRVIERPAPLIACR